MKYPRDIKITVGGVEITGFASGQAVRFIGTPKPGCWARCNAWGAPGSVIGQWPWYVDCRDAPNPSTGAIELCS